MNKDYTNKDSLKQQPSKSSNPQSKSIPGQEKSKQSPVAPSSSSKDQQSSSR